MSNTVQVNALGDACPIPVVKTIKALAGLSAGDAVETFVDNTTAVENLKRLGAEKNCEVVVEQVGDAEWHVLLTLTDKTAVAAADAQDVVCEVPQKRNLVVQVTSEAMGTGSDELGRNLMKAFIFAVTQQDELPQTMLFYNGGAHLTCEGSPVLDDLKSLADQGVEVMTCGTCLNHYGITDKLAVGEVTNMYVIVQKLEAATAIVRP